MPRANPAYPRNQPASARTLLSPASSPLPNSNPFGSPPPPGVHNDIWQTAPAKTDQDLSAQYGILVDYFYLNFGLYLLNPDTIGVDTYERMLDTDETIGSGFDFLVLAVLSTLGEYQNEQNPKAHDLVNEALSTFKWGNLQLACTEILSSLWAGFSATEIVWRPDGSRILPDYLVTYHPRTIRFRPDQQGRLNDESVLQFTVWNPTGLVLPKHKMILLTHGKRFGNWYGRSYFRRIYKNWLFKDHALKTWMKALDRYQTPLLVGHAPEKMVPDPEHPGVRISALDLMNRVMSRIQDDMTAIVLSTPTQKDEPEPDVKALLNPTTAMGEGFHQAMLYLNKMMYRGLLVPSTLADEGATSGSRALSRTHFDLFGWMADGIRQELTTALMTQLVRPLIDMNLGPQDDYGSFTKREVQQDEIAVLAVAYSQLTQQGYLDPQVQEDYSSVRQSVGLPDRTITPSDLVARQAALAGKAAAGQMGGGITAVEDRQALT